MMARNFSLAGLLRLRKLEQDVAADELASANRRLRENRSLQSRTRIALGATGTEPTDAAALTAMAASRAAMCSMLAELDAVGRDESVAVASANSQLMEARKRSIGLEKLATKHDRVLAAEDLRSEQWAIDELAGTAWHRREGGR